MSAAPPLIELRNLRKAYGGGATPAVEVLRGVSLTLRAGEFVALVGASGSGKSTLMNLLGCLDRPTSGSYFFAGRDVSRLAPDELAWLRREAFGFVFQGYHLIPTESARENVEVPAIYAGAPAAERRSRASALLTRLGLGDRLDHRPHQLSGGQQQRVSIARALMNGGRILLADEPTGALDSRSGAEVMALLDELAAQGHTVILITHDREVAARAHRIIEIRDGLIVADTAARVSPAAQHTLPPPDLSQAALDRGASLLADIAEAARAAWRVLWINRFRTALTLLGIVIGVASVIIMLAVGAGAQERVLAQMSAFGANRLYVVPAVDSAQSRAGRLTLADAEALRAVPGVDIVMPYLEGYVVARHGGIDHRTEGGGVNLDFVAGLNWPVARGQFFTAADERSMAKVVLLGERVREVLFPDGTDPIGRHVLLDNVPFLVIGVLAAKGALTGNTNEDDRVIFPFSTGAGRIFGSHFPSWLSIGIADLARAEETEQAVEDALRARHRVKDFHIYNRAAAINARSATEQTMTRLLGLIAAVSLLVGGIGVMNIMLMTVRERTREIGIRMATGARRRDILRQFLTEAVVVSLVGGAFGLVLGLGTGLALNAFDVPVIFSVRAVAGAFACALLTGLVFGYLPARKAARLDPVAALTTT
jgi:macrolide transport system ATP-binding/permease protein